jgi:hypothetical protein
MSQHRVGSQNRTRSPRRILSMTRRTACVRDGEPRSSRSAVIPILMVSALLVGCQEPHYFDLDGSWMYSASNLSGTDGLGNPVACSATGSMSLTGAATERMPNLFGGTTKVSVFNGTYSLTLVCMVNGGQQTLGPLQGTISDGEVLPYNASGSFYFDGDSVVSGWYNFFAVVSSDAMRSGTVSTTIDFGAPVGPVSMDGSFSAARQH